MANIRFEGDLTCISECQLEFVGRVLQNRGFSDKKVIASTVGKPGDGYFANIKRFSVEQNGVTFNMIAKIAPNDDQIRAIMNTKIVFNNESVMYTEILPKFTELEKKGNVPENERFRFAICYGTVTEEPNEIILLEDLQVSDFIMMDRLVSLTDDSVKLSLKSIATFHSLSYALKTQEPETYETLKSKLINTWELMNETSELFVTQIQENVVTVLDNDAHKLLVKRVLSQLISNILKYNNIVKDSKYSIIQQGDTWINNILFKLENDKSVECCMIDYQLSKHYTPVADLQYMIFNCTDYETRAKHYHDWIDYYHNELSKSLANFGLEVNFIYPRDQLESDLVEFGKIAFFLSLTLANLLLSESHEAAKNQEALKSGESVDKIIVKVFNLSNIQTSSFDRIKARIEGLVKSFTELGYL